ncbi:melanocortin-2 receptor accessory protein-like [Syngnathoides biaculeatus]|uniref:melanocortin-2 receptor accessory protein-like n=1 Tax=Syngnathoides biaculeatus TaxID=300417 RepID=UPI002ADD5DC8|nr:melanocortin-2 receptor accessory protein-like [Syngnathoides biaculeatus]
MDNSTRVAFGGWEYYYGYVDPVIVDESKLKYNKYSIVIAFWITLAGFVGVLFLTLNLLSGSGRSPWRRTQRRSQRRHTASSLI